jgi:hypothetical protein
MTAALLGLFTHFAATRDHSWGNRVGVTAAWFALAVLSKASGLVFGVLGILVIEIGRRMSRSRLGPSSSACVHPLRRDVVQIVVIGISLVFVYCGSNWEVSPSFVSWAHTLPDGLGKGAMVWLAEHLRIFSNAGVALIRQFRHNIQGHGVFLFDQVAPRAIWYYFPLALTVKVPVPIMVLPAVLAVSCPRALANWAWRVACAFLLFSLVCRVQTGIRLILPLLVVAVVGLASATADALGTLRAGARRRLVFGTAAIGGVWLAIAAWQVWPQGLCYTNELWGGTRLGYRCLSDSNYDWGQGLKELARWQKRHGVTDLTVFYYGTDPTLERLPMRRLEGEPPPTDGESIPAALRGRTLAVGTTMLYGSTREMAWVRPWADYLRRFEPVDRTTTFLIYRFPATAAEDCAIAERRK